MNLKLNHGNISYCQGRKQIGKFYRLNDNIQASKLRVIDAAGEQLGILTKLEALDKAREEELDLVEIAPNADPPVARIVDFKKLRYEEQKKEGGSKKASGGDLKELWLSPRIAEHDLQVRLRRTEEFFKEGHKVKLSVKFKGREMAHPELGHQLLQKALAHFGDGVEIEREPRFEGRRLSVIITKGKGPKKEETNGEQETENEQNNTEETKANQQG